MTIRATVSGSELTPELNLHDLAAVLAWEAAHPDHAERLAHYQARGSAIALIRASLQLGLTSNAFGTVPALLGQAYRLSTSRLESVLCHTLIFLHDAKVQFAAHPPGQPPLLPSITVLEGYLAEVRQPGSRPREVFSLEVEFRLLYALAYLHNGSGQPLSGLRHAQEAKSLAHMSGLRPLHYLADLMVLWAVDQQGQTASSLELHEQMRRDYDYPHIRHGHVSNLALLRADLGDVQGGLHLLREASSTAPDAEHHAIGQLLEALWGELDPEASLEATFTRAPGNLWLTQALQTLTGVGALEPVRSRRADLLERGGALARHLEAQPRHGDVRDRHLRVWLRAWAFRLQGQGAQAEAALQGSPPPPRNLLSLRLLHVGAGLELALSPRTGEAQRLPELEWELREVFAHAERLARASVPGLVDLLRRWHPWAALHGARMPQGVEALGAATEALVQVDDSNRAYGVVLPPLFVAERMLSAFEVSSGVPELNAAMRRQRGALCVRRGAALYWRPIFSALQVAYGLLKAGVGEGSGQSHRRAASQVLRHFGALPRGRSDYARVELETLHGAFMEALEAGNPAAFHAVLERLRG